MADIFEVRRLLSALATTLRPIADRDPHFDVRGIALAPLDAVIEEAKEAIGPSRVAEAIQGAISVASIATDEPVRAGEALIVVNLLLALSYNSAVKQRPTNSLEISGRQSGTLEITGRQG